MTNKGLKYLLLLLRGMTRNYPGPGWEKIAPEWLSLIFGDRRGIEIRTEMLTQLRLAKVGVGQLNKPDGAAQ